MAIRKLKNTYKAEFMYNGTRYYRNFRTESEALKWETDTKIALKHNLALPEEVSQKIHIRFGKVIDECYEAVFRHQSQGQEIHYQLKQITDVICADKPIDEIDYSHIEKFVNVQREKGNSNNTIRRKLAILGRIFTYALDKKYITAKPRIIKPQKTANTRLAYWTPEQEIEIIETLHEQKWVYFKHFFIWQIDTGMRPKEARAIHKRQVRQDPQVGWVVDLLKTKNNQRRTIPLTERAYEAFCFHLTKNSEHPFLYWSPTKIRTAWDNLRKGLNKTNDKNFVFYTTRHTCATRLVNNTSNIKLAQQWLGHETIEETLKYAKLQPQSLLDARETLQAIHT